jgi:hexaprenyl-diphosphate synthase
MRKTYLKTASLMAKSARASVILGGCGAHDEQEVTARMSASEVAEGERIKDIAYAYGRGRR